LRRKRLELQTATVRANTLQAQLDETNNAIASVNTQLGDLESRERSTRSRLAWNTLQLHAAQRSLELHDSLLKRRLVDIYEHGDLGYTAVILSARSFAEFVERWEDMRLLVAVNERAVRERKVAQARVTAVQTDLERAQLELAAQATQEQQTRGRLGALADERQNLAALAEAQRHRKATEVAEMEDLSASEEAQLEALIRERQEQLDAEAAAQRRAAGIAGVLPPPSAGAPHSFSWPVSGTITSPFGWRSNPFGGSPEFHQGLDIAAPSGTTVLAAAGGTVILAQWYGGYGNFILIDHGGSVATGYGHLSAIYVSAGQAVQRGQAIGAVGSTGQSTGPHLHFEVRVKGKPVDPAARLH